MAGFPLNDGLCRLSNITRGLVGIGDEIMDAESIGPLH